MKGHFEPFVAASGGAFAADGGVGGAGDGRQADAGGQVFGRGEGAGAADVDENVGRILPPMPHGGRDLEKRVGLP